MKSIFIANNAPISNNKRMQYAVYKLTGDISEEITEMFEHEHRAREFFSSRKALSNIFKNKKLSELTSKNHLTLDKYSNTLVSFSHTKNFGAAIHASIDEYQSVGIDIELKARKLKPGIEKMFLNPKDDKQDLLTLWCLKEAAFKAVEPLKLIDKVLVLKDIWITKNCFGIGEKEYGKAKLVELNNLLITAIAYI